MKKGRLFVISGPSGAGKSRICQELIAGGGFELSVSMTTRKRRGSEVAGISYYYVSMEEFQKTIAENGFLEHASIYGNCYGTPKAPVIEKLSAGKDVILEIEMQGAMQVKAAYPDAILIFVLPPSMHILRYRLIKRGTENEAQLAARMAYTLEEIKKIKSYDYFVINEDIARAASDVKAIARAEQLRVCGDTDSVIKLYEEEK